MVLQEIINISADIHIQRKPNTGFDSPLNFKTTNQLSEWKDLWIRSYAVNSQAVAQTYRLGQNMFSEPFQSSNRLLRPSEDQQDGWNTSLMPWRLSSTPLGSLVIHDLKSPWFKVGYMEIRLPPPHDISKRKAIWTEFGGQYESAIAEIWHSSSYFPSRSMPSHKRGVNPWFPRCLTIRPHIFRIEDSISREIQELLYDSLLSQTRSSLGPPGLTLVSLSLFYSYP